jgi:glucan biosynthesis protein
MAKNCGTNPYNVLEEGEVSVGETVTKNSQTKKDNSNNFGLDFKGFNLGDSGPKDEVNHAETSTKITLKEWHIGYNCNAEIATNVKEVKSKKK